MAVNVIRLTFVLLSIFTGTLGMLINVLESYLPTLLTRSYRYGKYSDKINQPIVAQCEVPKKWFQHFYLMAAPGSTLVLYLIIQEYFVRGSTPEVVFSILNLSLGSSRKPLVTTECCLLAAAILSIQCWKRLYETMHVNVFSDSKMNISHYIAGFLHYIGTLLSIIGESNGFVEGTVADFSWNRITPIRLLAACIFLVCSYTQLHACFILRNLRSDENGKTSIHGYKIPHGGLFDYVSGALQTTEIIMYSMLSVILWESHTYHFITLWVFVNQVECAFLTHWWYQTTFASYPKNRKALIPYIF